MDRSFDVTGFYPRGDGVGDLVAVQNGVFAVAAGGGVARDADATYVGPVF